MNPRTTALIAPTELTDRLTGDPTPTLVDVRTPAEYETAHIPGSINIPLPLMTEHATALAAELDGPVVLVCQAGTRARTAHTPLAAAGAEQLSVLDGGVTAYTATGQPIRRGRARWALERQVRLVAGGLVATSILASLRFPRARFLAGGIGAGLATAAVTDTCAMGAALSRLPYNRGGRAVTLRDAVQALRSRRAAGSTPS
ncbi:rhodanese-like domain-containing protein [Geodermatophilus sabuli]|uniref:Rhodanese-related sulfurtransferase n=1 Tax=Geodermatophilus sabuli TaxID=1564158 RepID=A0A285ECZ4_9ACTN|nr:rhodanese-like domain-containing protein [Geodermatophilus sabuli]MBB3083265.1 rhodanese-related sulfurtransferase [Geodermatophilus sabuli]SNX97012.1 Rhodanese-related sulfurtransferase [Geodermatophilus sabuli]